MIDVSSRSSSENQGYSTMRVIRRIHVIDKNRKGNRSRKQVRWMVTAVEFDCLLNG